jgi:hypothetical protein
LKAEPDWKGGVVAHVLNENLTFRLIPWGEHSVERRAYAGPRAVVIPVGSRPYDRHGVRRIDRPRFGPDVPQIQLVADKLAFIGLVVFYGQGRRAEAPAAYTGFHELRCERDGGSPRRYMCSGRARR